MPSVEDFMRVCIDAAHAAAAPTAYALAACVVKDNRVISLRASGLIASTDPSAHPEMEAVREATRLVGSRYLPGAVLYSTLEPCPMCMSVAIWAKMAGVVFGASQSDALRWARQHPSTVKTWRQIRMRASELARRGDPVVPVHGGILRDECMALLAL